MVRFTSEYRAKFASFNNRRSEMLTNYAIFKDEQKIRQDLMEDLDEQP